MFQKSTTNRVNSGRFDRFRQLDLLDNFHVLNYWGLYKLMSLVIINSRTTHGSRNDSRHLCHHLICVCQGRGCLEGQISNVFVMCVSNVFIYMLTLGRIIL